MFGQQNDRFKPDLDLIAAWGPEQVIVDEAQRVQNLKMPLPSPETARQLANAPSALADTLRGRIA
ncbi:MAG TPA: hypothetical protein VHX39_29420 [Acetobacteraceae bacterium]|nr:hypothetical protein [Acetobacteraceae bacterium]